MPRILIITESWPSHSAAAPLLRDAAEQAGYTVVVITREEDGARTGDEDIIRLPYEPPRRRGRLFGLRNALFFDTAANPGNYAVLRDTLHLHLQEVLYDAVLVLCPPDIYLKLCFWIDETFGIPVWVHLDAGLQPVAGDWLGRWNRDRLRRKYLSRARMISSGDPVFPHGLPLHEAQAATIAQPGPGGIRFVDARSGQSFDTAEALERITRRQL